MEANTTDEQIEKIKKLTKEQKMYCNGLRGTFCELATQDLAGEMGKAIVYLLGESKAMLLQVSLELRREKELTRGLQHRKKQLEKDIQ